MSTIDGITGPNASSTALRGTGIDRTRREALEERLGRVVRESFARDMGTVYDRGVAGEFDDPQLRLREQAAMARLREVAGGLSVQGGGGGIAAGVGSSIAPGATTIAPADSATPEQVQAQREVYTVRVEQSFTRVANVSQKLRAEYPLAAQLESAATGRWDPATFVPKSRAEAQAFAQRMVIDATEAAAHLDVVKNELDLARFEAQVGGTTPAATAQIAKLTAEFRRQNAYVEKLATIVDRASGGVVGDAGDDAIAGRSLRAVTDVSTKELVSELRRAGMDDEAIEVVIGAGELAVEEDATPGGSARLREASDTMAAYFTERMLVGMAERAEEHRRTEQAAESRQAERARRDDQRASERKQQHVELRTEATERVAAQRAHAFEAWLARQDAARRPA